MKNSKKLLLAIAAIVATVNADENSLMIKIGEHASVEIYADNDAEDKNIARQLARSCGDENFEMILKLRGKPFAIDKNTIGRDAEDAFFDNLRALLFSEDENGKNALDLVKEREKATGCLDCTLLKEIYKGLMRDVLNAEHERDVKVIEAEIGRNQ